MRDNLQKNEDGKWNWIYLLVFFILSVIIIVFGILYFSESELFNSEGKFVLFSAILGGVVCILFLISVAFVLHKKMTLAKTMISLLFLLAFCSVSLFILQKIGFFKIFRDADELEIFIQESGAFMPLFYIVLQYLQVIVLPIPSIVSTMVGAKIFGAFYATLYSFIGIILGSITAFFIGRKLGNRAVGWIIGKETLKKWQQKLKGKDNFFFSLMFLLPFFPDDVLCFFAGLSTMTSGYFLLIISVSRLIGIVGTCYSIDFIPFNTWWGILIWILIAVVLFSVFFLVYKNLDKIQKFFKKRRKKRDETDKNG